MFPIIVFYSRYLQDALVAGCSMEKVGKNSCLALSCYLTVTLSLFGLDIHSRCKTGLDG